MLIEIYTLKIPFSMGFPACAGTYSPLDRESTCVSSTNTVVFDWFKDVHF